MPHQYTVINASAGSGKTYALVLRLLAICLRYPNQSDAIRHILALTFTNKAANEMKQRILKWLKDFSSGNYSKNQDLKNIQKKLESENIKVSIDDLHERSKKVLDYILHHYSTLNIGTIDKFNSRLVRSFSYELGLAQNFNLEIQAEPFLMEAVDKMLDEIGENKQISEAFMDFVNYNLDNNEKVNINQALYSSAKEFVQDKHYFNLDSNKNFDWEAYNDLKQKLRKEISELKKNSFNITRETLHLLHERNLDMSDFSGGSRNSIAKFFVETEKFYKKERKEFPFPGNEESALITFCKGSSVSGKNRETEISEIIGSLIDKRNKIISNYIISQKKEKILHEILPLKVNKDIQDKLSEIEEENDLVLLSKFNVIIHENLRKEPSSFIYEKVGTRFYHYFFDEFQDTSQLQWENFSPLRDHAITSESMSFTLVGDPKQSIYRFRGGDSQMMLEIIHNKEKAPVKAFVESLNTNWRSAKNIVAFNNQLYEYLSKSVNIEHEDIFGKGSQQVAHSEKKGRVKINFIENANKNIFYEYTAEKMKEDIQECINYGFKFSDITILCRGNSDIFAYSQLLGNMKIELNGIDCYIKTISEKGLTLNLSNTILSVIEFLKWHLNPKDNISLVKMLYYLNVSGKIQIEDFTQEILKILKKEDRKNTEDIIHTLFGIQLKQNNIPHLNLYNFIEYYVLEFAIHDKETDFILNFLEMLYNFSQNTGMTIKDFLKFWDEEGQNISIQTSENIDAIQIMTIHKAKGLEFPIVFLPMENESKDSKFKAWLNTSEETLSSVIISPFDNILENYDHEMAEFNKKHIYENKIDRYCLQYVATTRAVEQMFFYIEKPNKSGNQLEIYDFACEIYNEKYGNSSEKKDSFEVFNLNKTDLLKGNQEITASPKTQKITPIKRQLNSGVIKIATPSKNYQVRNERVKTGIFAHEILSKVNTEKDLYTVLRSYIINGTINDIEANIISERIKNIMNHPEYSAYFSDHLKIINEKEIIISEQGESYLYRPDRIIETENGYIIIDFKTGEKEEQHHKQIENYRNVLEKIGKKIVETKLIYI